MNHSVTMSCKYVIQDYIHVREVNALAYINILRAMTMNAFSILHDSVSGGMQYHTIMHYYLYM